MRVCARVRACVRACACARACVCVAVVNNATQKLPASVFRGSAVNHCALGRSKCGVHGGPSSTANLYHLVAGHRGAWRGLLSAQTLHIFNTHASMPILLISGVRKEGQ